MNWKKFLGWALVLPWLSILVLVTAMDIYQEPLVLVLFAIIGLFALGAWILAKEYL